MHIPVPERNSTLHACLSTLPLCAHESRACTPPTRDGILGSFWYGAQNEAAFNNMPATPRLRSACDSCHRLKVRCSGSKPCVGCTATNTPCVYSLSNRLGRPVGSRNKRDAAKATGSTEKRLFDRRGREAQRPLHIPGIAPWTGSPTLDERSESVLSLDDSSDIAPPSAQYTAIPNARPLGSAGMLPQKTWNPGFQALSPV